MARAMRCLGGVPGSAACTGTRYRSVGLVADVDHAGVPDVVTSVQRPLHDQTRWPWLVEFRRRVHIHPAVPHRPATLRRHHRLLAALDLGPLRRAAIAPVRSHPADASRTDVRSPAERAGGGGWWPGCQTAPSSVKGFSPAGPRRSLRSLISSSASREHPLHRSLRRPGRRQEPAAPQGLPPPNGHQPAERSAMKNWDDRPRHLRPLPGVHAVPSGPFSGFVGGASVLPITGYWRPLRRLGTFDPCAEASYGSTLAGGRDRWSLPAKEVRHEDASSH